MPVYNAGDYLRPAIDSILSQTFSDFEFLIVDDGSTDQSVAVIQSYSDPRIRLIQQTNQGCYPARNRAIAESRGKYLANMDSDDISLPERFEKQVGFLESHPEAVLVGTRTLGCDLEDTVRLAQPDASPILEHGAVPHQVLLDPLRVRPPFACQAIAFRGDVARGIGGYDQRLCYSADVDFIYRAAAHGLLGCIPDRLYVFRLVPTAISGMGSPIQAEILDLLGGVYSRGEIGQDSRFTAGEIKRLKELTLLRKTETKGSDRRRQAYYYTRLATLYRVNGRRGDALRCAIRALTLAPTHLFLDRKLLSNLVKTTLHSGRSGVS